jgi:hypothetical protein
MKLKITGIDWFCGFIIPFGSVIGALSLNIKLALGVLSFYVLVYLFVITMYLINQKDKSK